MQEPINITETKEKPVEVKNGSWWRVDVHPYVFTISALLILGAVILTLALHQHMETVFGAIQTNIASYGGWFLVATVNVILLFILYLLLSRYGDIRLGGHDAKPEFSNLGWLAMLFSAGMGIGLLFYGVAEPINHYVKPPFSEARTPEAAREAMGVTFLHWGLHPWAIYCLVGLSLAFFSFNKGLPLSIRSVFYPLFGERIHGALGNVVDILATVATLFGVATSLGFGVQQINAGLDHLFGFGQTTIIQVFLIAGITAIATWSVVKGLDGGIRFLSEINLYVAGGLLLFVLILGPTLFILNAFVQNIGHYLQHLPNLATWNETYADASWQNGWTVFYWGWWIAWSPFVGMFIARVSYGRTVREFVFCVLLVPTLVTFFWITTFGNTALYLEMSGHTEVSEAVLADNTPVSLFLLLESFPWSFITAILAVGSIVMFFVTSSDSGSMVIDIITAGGNPDPPVPQRLFWAILEGVVAAVLLVGGGLAALQTAAIATGLPFAIVLLIMCFSLRKGFFHYKTSTHGFKLPPYKRGQKLTTPLSHPTPATSGMRELWLKPSARTAGHEPLGK